MFDSEHVTIVINLCTLLKLEALMFGLRNTSILYHSDLQCHPFTPSVSSLEQFESIICSIIQVVNPNTFKQWLESIFNPMS